MSWDYATEWNFLVKIPRGSLKQDLIKHYIVEQSGIRGKSFFSLNLLIGLIWDRELETATPISYRQLRCFSIGFTWHVSLPAPSVAPLVQREVAQALTPAITSALLPKPSHLSKQRVFFLAGSETAKTAVTGWNTEQENKKESSYLLSISVWYSYIYTSSGASYTVPSKLADNEEREKEGIKHIDCSMCHYSQEMTIYPSKTPSPPEYYVQHWSLCFKRNVKELTDLQKREFKSQRKIQINDKEMEKC